MKLVLLFFQNCFSDLWSFFKMAHHRLGVISKTKPVRPELGTVTQNWEKEQPGTVIFSLPPTNVAMNILIPLNETS